MKKKGFTLIELLAVIVILAIIALISTPIIIGVIEKARRGAFEDSAYGVLDAAKLYFTDKLADTNSFSKTEIDFNGDMKDFKLSGEKPYGGSLIIDSDGKQAIAIYDKDHKWCATKNLEEEKIRIIDNYKKCDKDIAENLIINGYGEYGNNTNFPELEYVKEDQSFKNTSDSRIQAISEKKILIDPNATYQFSIDAKSSHSNSTYYAGILEYDIDGLKVNISDVNYIAGSLTELTRDLNNGDTKVYLKNISNWVTTPIYVDFPYLNQGFIFWNYKDSTGYTYGSETYSKNKWFSLYEYTNMNKTDNTITLNNPWDHGTIKAGTKLSQSNSGADFNYSLMENNTLSSSYQTYSNQITGYGGTQGGYTNFRHGTKSVLFSSYLNYNSTPNTTTHYKNIILKKV